MNLLVDHPLPAKPFIDWLRDLRRREAIRLDVAEDRANDPLARTLGVSRKLLATYIDGKAAVVPFSTADLAVSRQGTWSLYDIWPPEVLDRVDLTLKADGRYTCHDCGIELRRKAHRCGFCEQERRGRVHAAA